MLTRYINLEHVKSIAQGDDKRFLLYLTQFNELIPERLEILKIALVANNREEIRQILHKMSPQLQFFGVQNITVPIQRLESEYQIMPSEMMNEMILEVIGILELALSEVRLVLENMK